MAVAFWGGHRNFSKAPWEKNGYYELILRIANFQILLKAYLQPTGMTVRWQNKSIMHSTGSLRLN